MFSFSFSPCRNYYEKPEEIWIYLDGSEESIIMIHLARVVSNKLRHCSKMKLRAICFKSDILKSEINEFFNEIKNMYNVELCKLEYEENDAVRAIKNFALSKPELRKLLVGKRLKNNEKEIYNDLERLNDSSTQFVHFPLIDWTNKDVENFFNSLFLPYYTIKS